MSTEIENKENEIGESFEALLAETPIHTTNLVGKVIKGVIVDIRSDSVIIDVGLKSEGKVPVKEFTSHGKEAELNKFDEVDVYVEKMEDKDGMIVLSHEKARREAAWIELEKACEAKENVDGVIFGRVKGGFTVDLNGAVAFLPGSQLDVRPIKDVNALMGIEQPFQILKMDRSRGNIVVSRRAILEESRSEARNELLATVQEGVVLDGVVKNITDYGAFVDLGGLDGLLHVTDISWKRLSHPSEVLNVGQNIKVQVIRYNKETGRISLGMKQLENDPWENIETKFPLNSKVVGVVTNITDYGAFVELDAGVEGLIHVSEMSWTKKNIHPGKLLSTSQEVEVMVLEIDPEKRRVALGIKQCIENPWEKAANDHPIGNVFEGQIRNITEFGLFVAVSEDLDGMVHMSDIAWGETGEDAIKNFKVGEVIKVKVVEVDPDKERIALSIKQLEADPFEDGISDFKKNQVVTCEVTKITDNGVEVHLADGVHGFIRKNELSKERSEQRPDRFAVGEKIDAKITMIDRKLRKVALSIRSREIEEEKEVMKQYGSTDSGASLGEILGAAFEKVQAEKDSQGKD